MELVIDIQKRLINRHSAYNTACHTSYERLSEPLIMFTVRSQGLLGIPAASPLMLLFAQALLGALNPQRFSLPISLEPHKYLFFKKKMKDKKATRAGLLNA